MCVCICSFHCTPPLPPPASLPVCQEPALTALPSLLRPQSKARSSSYSMLPTQHLCDALRLLLSESKCSPSGKDGGLLAEIATPRVTALGFDWRDSKAFSTQPSGSPQLRLFLDCGSRICQNSFSHKWQMAPTPRSSSQSESLRGPSGTMLRLWRRKRGQHICSGWALPAKKHSLPSETHSIEWMSDLGKCQDRGRPSDPGQSAAGEGKPGTGT